MGSNYKSIICDNLAAIFDNEPPDLALRLGAEKDEGGFKFSAFGRSCLLRREGIFLDGIVEEGPRAILISLYAMNAVSDQIRLEPFVAFKDLPNSMPYSGAFSANSEMILVPHVQQILEKRYLVMERFNGHNAPEGLGGDESFVLYPLPKIGLAYIFYLADEEFPASVTCLFSSNALSFMPLDGLADVAEYTSRSIIQLISSTV
ncbi:MAG: hypothetical protein DRH12_13315 [Deltaproteobacteria bacterium]|nr:MAG: hypothetical protein DRH12_13315 [Deltaproteobacteria bacterium]